MEKVINLKSDRVFRHAVRLVENKNYCTRPGVVEPALHNLARVVTNRISVLSKRGKLDATDIKIIAMRQRTPMPTWREMGADLHMTKQAVHFRAEKIKKSIMAGLRRDF